MVLQLLTSLLRGGESYVVELARSNAIGMLAHLLSRCPAAFMSAELLAALCMLEAALAPYRELSDALLLQVPMPPLPPQTHPCGCA